MIVVLVLIVILVGMYLTYSQRMQVRDCRWRQNRDRDTQEGRYYICMTCGAETRRREEGSPPICLRQT